MEKKSKIYVFDPEVYPRKLFVVKGKDAGKFIRSAFTTTDGSELDIDVPSSTGSATYQKVSLNNTNWLGALVWIYDSSGQKAYHMAHEAVHIVNGLFAELGIDFGYEHDEHYAYMVGWVTDCLIQALTGKLKDK